MYNMNKLKAKTPKRSTTKAPIEEPEAEPIISHGQNLYHLGAEIGKGGFAVVFQAFNAHTGQTVAVKRFPLSAIAGKDSQLSVEMAEIELMHELDHPHIVKYYDTVKTKNFLYIVLEYMENGSLATVIKKFGALTESLAAIYIAQVLRGLKYLHDQGVLHRDIKGANILTSKDGMVKLADFGVAIKINSDGANSGPSGGMEDNPDLAGSPYWMAPEIIEMSTPTSACDIWSVGCVVIELLTSKPPYFDMDPMSALFRIVSDDYPPFPEGISQALKDFLLQCFHKEPSMRSSAEKLLGHPWLGNSSSKQSLVQTSQMLKSRSIDLEGDVAAGRSTEVIQSAVRMYERGLNTIPEEGSVADELSPKSTNRDTAPNTQRSAVETAAAWPELTLTGRASLPGSNGDGSRSRSRSHSNGGSGSDDDTVRRGEYDSDFALSGESNLSSVASTTAAQVAGPASTALPLASMRSEMPTSPQVPRDPSLERSFDLNSISASSTQSIGIAASFSTSVSPEKVPPTKTSILKMSSLSVSDKFQVESGSSSSTMKSMNSSGSFLQGMSMKMVSEDSFDDINNWELELSASRDSAEGPLARKTLARNTLTNVKQIASPRVPALKEPYLINLSSQTLSFVASEGDKAVPAGPTPVPSSGASTAAASAPAATSSSAGVAGGASKKVTIPLINIPKLAMPSSYNSQNTTSMSTSSKGGLSMPNSGLSLYSAAGEHSHHSSIDLNKYQEDNSEDDFGEDFEPPESARERAPVRFAETTKGIVPRHPNLANNGINDDDFEGDFMFEGGGLHDRIKAFKETATADLGLMSNRSSNPSSADSFREDSSPRTGSIASATPRGANLASHLRKKIALVANKDSPVVGDEDLDAFINYQYDEKDFKQNEAKDLHYRRSREIVEVMNRIRLETKAKEVVDLCNQLLVIFSEVPEQRDHLITHHGVMPIVDMFDARAPTSYRTGAQSAKNTKALYVLKVVNKIIDGSIKAKEQLSLVGIIPTVMNLFEGSFRHAVYHHPHHLVHSSGGVNAYTSNQFSSSTSSDSAEINNLSPSISLTDSPRPPLVPQILMREDLDPLTLEAARFLHQISSTSSLTLQMLIGAGGLSVLTSMVSLGATFTAPGTSGTAASTAANHSAAMALVVPPSNTDSRSPSTAPRGIASIASNFSYDFGDAVPVTDQQLSDDTLFGNKPGQVNVTNVPETEDAQNRMTIFQMGVDCVTEVFAMKASRSRDFCRLFAKLGLLQPLSLSFQNVLGLYRARQMNITNVSANATTGGSGTSSSTLSPRDSKSSSLHLRRDSSVASPRNTPRLTTPRQLHTPRHGRESSGEVSSLGSFLMHAMHQDAEESQECKYAHRIAQLFFTFSRSDAIVAETMVKAEHCVLHVMLTVLQAPELRTQIVGGRITPSTSMAVIGKGEVSLSSASLSAHNASHSASSPNLFRRTHGNLLPTYVEIVDLLLKCLKNLSMEPSALADLEAAGTLDTLVPLLSGPISDRCKNHILPCIFNMCRVNKRRQERVAWLGLVPHLKKVITDGSPLRQFALPILFDLAHTSAATRAELCKWSCLPFFLDLLKENYWQAFALNSIAVWMANDTAYVAGLLVENAHLSRLIDFFRSAPSATIHTLHRPLLDMMFKSPELCKALGLSRLFASALVKRLKSTDEAIVLRSLLKMLQLMHELHDSPKLWVETNKLEALVEEFAKSERKVLVRQLAKKLLLDFKETTTSRTSEKAPVVTSMP